MIDDDRYHVSGRDTIEQEMILKIEEFFSDYAGVAEDAIEMVRDILDSLGLAIVQNTDPLNLTTDIGHTAEDAAYYCYSQGTCLFRFAIKLNSVYLTFPRNGSPALEWLWNWSFWISSVRRI